MQSIEGYTDHPIWLLDSADDLEAILDAHQVAKECGVRFAYQYLN